MKMIKYEEDSQDILYEQVQPEFALPVKVVEVNLSGDEIECQVPKHWHRSVEIIVPRIESTEAWIEGNICQVGPHDFLIINSKEIHSCRGTLPHVRYLGYAVQIKYDFIKSCFPEIEDYAFQSSYMGQYHQKIEDLLNQIIDYHLSEEKYKHLMIYSLAYELLFYLIKYCSYPKQSGYSIQSMKQKTKLIQILSYLDEICDENFDVQEVAEHFHMSYGYLANLFTKYLHMSMTEYVNSVRIKKIEKDLILTDSSIMDICLSHGFTNTKSFYREFAKYHKQTPKEYRKSARYHPKK